MSAPTPAMRDLARRLLVASPQQAGGSPDPRKGGQECAAVVETLRLTVTRFAGPDGFEALLKRAIALARAEVPALKDVKLGADCQIEGFEGVVVKASEEAALALAAHLLTLLVTFIGEPLTLRLVREGWPDAKLDESGPERDRRPL